jgi:hypothetical protein
VKGNLVASKKTRRMIVLGAFAVMAAAGPAFAATTISTSAPQDYQALPPGCRSHFGNMEDGICLDGDGGTPINIGTPFGQYGPNNYNNNYLLPGQTWTNGAN